MTDEQFETFIKECQDLLRHLYEKETAVSFSEATALCRKGKDGETFTEDKPLRQYVVFGDGLGDAETRFETQRLVQAHDAFAVMVKWEAWFVETPKDASPELRERIARAGREQALDKLETPLRREKVIVHFESEDHPIRIVEAEIFRRGEGRTPGLGEWRPPPYEVRLPRPNFRRYVSEVRDGKRAFALNVPGSPMTIRTIYGDAK